MGRGEAESTTAAEIDLGQVTRIVPDLWGEEMEIERRRVLALFERVHDHLRDHSFSDKETRTVIEEVSEYGPLRAAFSNPNYDAETEELLLVLLRSYVEEQHGSDYRDLYQKAAIATGWSAVGTSLILHDASDSEYVADIPSPEEFEAFLNEIVTRQRATINETVAARNGAQEPGLVAACIASLQSKLKTEVMCDWIIDRLAPLTDEERFQRFFDVRGLPEDKRDAISCLQAHVERCYGDDRPEPTREQLWGALDYGLSAGDPVAGRHLFLAELAASAWPDGAASFSGAAENVQENMFTWPDGRRGEDDWTSITVANIDNYRPPR